MTVQRFTIRMLGRFVMKTTPAQLQRTTFLLGRQPRSHAEYARDMAAEWAAAALPALA